MARRSVATLVAHDLSVRQFVPAGHFYSPIPSLADIRRREAAIFTEPPSLMGIDLRMNDQLDLVRTLASYYADHPFGYESTPSCRYHFENGYFEYGDALMLYGLLRHLRPRRVVEVGSGFSTALIRDTIRRHDLTSEHVAIDPFPRRARELLGESTPGLEIMPTPLQDVDLDVFLSLGRNDMLFVDSTHVSKVGSDVNLIMFEILPRLEPGVIVHFHDVFYPFEYPREWIYVGRAWNESYLLRGFLTFNEKYRILLFNDLLGRFHSDAVGRLMPLWLKDPGASLWLERL
jgi:hypothetical protein